MKQVFSWLTIAVCGSIADRAASRAPSQPRAGAVAGADVHDHSGRSRRMRHAAYSHARPSRRRHYRRPAPAPETVTVAMTGTPAADSYLGCTSTATQTFRPRPGIRGRLLRPFRSDSHR